MPPRFQATVYRLERLTVLKNALDEEITTVKEMRRQFRDIHCLPYSAQTMKIISYLEELRNDIHAEMQELRRRG